MDITAEQPDSNPGLLALYTIAQQLCSEAIKLIQRYAYKI